MTDLFFIVFSVILLPKPKDIAMLRNKAFVKLHPLTEASEEKPQSHFVFLFTKVSQVKIHKRDLT